MFTRALAVRTFDSISPAIFYVYRIIENEWEQKKKSKSWVKGYEAFRSRDNHGNFS